MQKNPPPSCCLYGFMARDAPKAVFLRRGPSKWVQQIVWHTDTDRFAEGQWLKGRVSPYACDLSPDGSLFLYLARKAECPERRNSDYTYKWTAISRPPYFTALALWPLGDEGFGGGAFLENDTVRLYHQTAHAHPNHQPKESLIVIDHAMSLANPQPDSSWSGWHCVQKPTYDGSVTKKPWVYHKLNPQHRSLLVKEIHRTQTKRSAICLNTFYFVVDTTNQMRVPVMDVEWADWDQQGRLAFTRGGTLFVASASLPPTEAKPIADFTTNVYTAIITPDWAQRW